MEVNDEISTLRAALLKTQAEVLRLQDRVREQDQAIENLQIKAWGMPGNIRPVVR